MKKCMALLLTVITFMSVALSGNTAKASAEYQYLQNVSEQEWQNMNHVEMIEACRIPDDILNNMSSEELLQAFLSYPIIADIIAFNTYRQGFETMLEESDALRELMKREDRASVILNYYQQLSAAPAAKQTATYSNMSTGWFLEILLAQPEMIDAMSEDQIKTLNETSSKKESTRLKYPELYQSSVYTFQRALQENYSPSSYVSGKVKSAGTTNIPTTAITQDGVVVRAYNRSPDFTDAEKAAQDNIFLSAYSGVTKIRTSTIKYNCHSYAYVNQSANNAFWIEDADASTCWHGIYTNSTTPVMGGKIYYGNAREGLGTSEMHSGIVNSTVSGTAYIISKWGAGPLVGHRYDKCPYYEDGTYVVYKKK